eukprot:CAMPEP_0174239654 /NCGR_PEP_ID=MMETSP0417-20130205/15550_1 /TAXON_ID=242541 /ORGANISM="Mayorella sp, Strain BSH-02190019" /LENGTH=804 /DNA_ID=CAMNT_0015318615 /DNA_START=110 /DNA_END=2521 /DNA_ORIENTATION=+
MSASSKSPAGPTAAKSSKTSSGVSPAEQRRVRSLKGEEPSLSASTDSLTDEFLGVSASDESTAAVSASSGASSSEDPRLVDTQQLTKDHLFMVQVVEGIRNAALHSQMEYDQNMMPDVHSESSVPSSAATAAESSTNEKPSVKQDKPKKEESEEVEHAPLAEQQTSPASPSLSSSGTPSRLHLKRREKSLTLAGTQPEPYLESARYVIAPYYATAQKPASDETAPPSRVSSIIPSFLSASPSSGDENEVEIKHYSQETGEEIDPKEYVSMKDYAPEIFRDLRVRAGMSTQDYIESWDFGGPHNVPAPAEGAGRSGSLFLKSANKRCMFKTIPPIEVKTLRAMLPRYHAHLMANPSSHLMRFFGLHRFHNRRTGTYVYLCVFTNALYQPGLPIRETYDLKGRPPKPGKLHRNRDVSPSDYVFKDNDLERGFYPKERVHVLHHLHADVEFLRQQGCMDYSLLIGVHQLSDTVPENADDAADALKGSKWHANWERKEPEQPAEESASKQEEPESSSAAAASAATVPASSASSASSAASSSPSSARRKGFKSLSASDRKLLSVNRAVRKQSAEELNTLVHKLRTEYGLSKVEYMPFKSSLHWLLSGSSARRHEMALYLVGNDLYDPTYVDTRNRNALHIAAREGKLELVRELFRTHPEMASAQSTSGRNALHYAAAEGQLDCIKLLIELGVPLNVKDAKGRTPAACAQRKEHSAVVDFLKARGAISAATGAAAPVKKTKNPTDNEVVYPYYSDPEHGERYFICIIDFLSRYTARKKAANFFKTFLWAEETISTVNPDMYADRYTRYFA